ncbi:16S rRNA (adenine1518-N6/adenine1519-N6)-dimethyltransferase [Clostridium tetanomorphum]|uniref:Ribosomal RNA small subunit methyltransferase A n=1 Tax=Clostridium tetanomorphum TaxID=1553 RepID=A0A923ECC5_CLOTT|nr:16S rRNA (adenine(1518)-N(6)/adenine(1519)-N(6))-dimethyltransferase RsmA [Clostridium tetanomorphum]KAJ49980.1 16S ribosomal RNA methyltransferase KsgA/Dim1 family protein [Clostridium tetanomorphum DSM 665]MBC2399307.1 16S rRNA (adenine(1518)-N(6)/adenine(1519)-N(6))-dimethyltransferase RsmA [Clostridium tetanomorphum]MBP1866111.1 16S rRNA (adenine1518-N6/adenine1519-N6)-dimethyltransferase [Clostridium tetanomorphum]NRS86739.1 16S rRNA (adenine1518-N6/adenine1519-N6)-dimethyltransferase [
MEKNSTKEIVNKHNFKFSKSLGQNFLIDEQVLADIVEGAEVNKNDFIIEIGPGVGSLTKELLKVAKKVTAIELDKELLPILNEELKDYENFSLINNDALKVNFNEIIGEETSVKLVANLPYYVTTPIISKLLNENYKFKSLTIMIQKEVGERIAANPNTKEYGALSLLVQYYCDIKVIRRVSPSSFIPKPKVDSIVIRLDKLNSPKVEVENKDLFFKIIRASFNMRRKTILNALKSLGINKEMLEKALEEVHIDAKRRGETFSIQEFARLSDCINKIQ